MVRKRVKCFFSVSADGFDFHPFKGSCGRLIPISFLYSTLFAKWQISSSEMFVQKYGFNSSKRGYDVFKNDKYIERDSLVIMIVVVVAIRASSPWWLCLPPGCCSLSGDRTLTLTTVSPHRSGR